MIEKLFYKEGPFEPGGEIPLRGPYALPPKSIVRPQQVCRELLEKSFPEENETKAILVREASPGFTSKWSKVSAISPGGLLRRP